MSRRSRKAPGGRPTRLLELDLPALPSSGSPPGSTRLEAGLSLVRAGAPPSRAFLAAAGIAPSTLREWLARGEGRDPDRGANAPYASFAAQVAQARAAFINRVAVAVTASIPRNPAVGLQILAGVAPDEYAWVREQTGAPAPPAAGVTFLQPQFLVRDAAEAHDIVEAYLIRRSEESGVPLLSDGEVDLLVDEATPG